MSEGNTTIIVAGVCQVLLAIIAAAVLYLQNKTNARKADEKANIIVDKAAVIEEKADIIEKKATIIEEKTVVIADTTGTIHELTNSTKSKLERSLEIADRKAAVSDERIIGLEKMLATFMKKNGGDHSGAKSIPQIDSIEKTGYDTNVKVTNLEEKIGKKVEKIEEKLDT